MIEQVVRRIVIIGAGQAGGWAAKALRDAGFAGTLTLIGDEPHPPHERPPLSKAVLSGKADPASTHLFKPELFTGLNVDWRKRTTAVRIDRADQTVDLHDGEVVHYDRLLICTGGRARLLDVAGAAEGVVHVLRTLDDAQRLARALQVGRRLVVVGGGWIGLEVAATARGLGLDVAIVESATRVCARVVPPVISGILQDMHARQGVMICTGAGIDRIESRADGSFGVVLSDGANLIADCLLAGVGLIPNDELARSSGLECDGGILVDARCATSDPRIFAAGDVAVSPNSHAACAIRLESWQNAQDQGVAAARAAMGIDIAYDPMPRFWSDQYDTNLQIIGWPRATDEVVVRGDVAQGRFVAFSLDQRRVRAAFAFNAARELRAARKIIEAQVMIDPLRLADPAIDLSTMLVA